MSDKQGWKERLRGDVRLTLPEKPDIVGRYTSCERFLPEEQKPVRAWIAAGAACTLPSAAASSKVDTRSLHTIYIPKGEGLYIAGLRNV